jgi:hypothetical protein
VKLREGMSPGLFVFGERYERRTDRLASEHEIQRYHELSEKLAEQGITMTGEQAGDWAAKGFNAATAEEFITAGFAVNESGSAQTYHAAGLYDGTEAYLERLEDETNDLVYQADQIEEREIERAEDFDAEYEVDAETGLVKRRPEPPEDPWAPDPPVDLSAETQAEADYADSWGDIEAARAQEQGERLADEADARAGAATGDVLDDIDSAIDDAEATSAGWTADDQAAFDAEVDGAGGGEPNPLYVPPADDPGLIEEPDAWPPVGREPTAEELESGVAVANEDGSTSWCPANDDDWTDADEARAAGHPAYQAEGVAEQADEDRFNEQYQEDTLRYAVGADDDDGGDLVVSGVVYDRDQWQADGEGGVEPRLSPEAEDIARGVEEREAAMDAMEADEDMVGSDAWQARQYEEQWDDRGDAEETARVEEDAAERASYEAEQREEVEAEQRGGLDFEGDLEEAQAGLNDNPLPRPPGRPEPDDTPGGADGGDDYSGPFAEGSADGYGQEEPF